MGERIRKVKQRVFEIISKGDNGDWLSLAFDWLIVLLIALSIVCIVLESFAEISRQYSEVFHVLEEAITIVFSIEYLLRIWTADLLYPNEKHPRIKYFISFAALIDLIAILPFYLPIISADLRFLRMMRLFRLFRLLRVFKLGRYFEAFQIIVKVIRTSWTQLIVSIIVCFFVMLFSAIIMYTVENPVQPDQFPNVISALWWAMCTLTTVGYGDVYPITAIGKFFASVISLVGIGIIAIPTGIIAAGFNKIISQQTEGSDESMKQDIEELNGSVEIIGSIERMKEDELVLLLSKAGQKLSDYGYQVTIDIVLKK